MLSADCYHFSIKFKPFEEFQHTRDKRSEVSPPLHFVRMRASNKKADGPQSQAIGRVNHEWNATNLFHIIQHLLHWKKKIVTTFVIIDLLSPDSMWISGWKDLNYSCSTVHQPKTVAVHCSRASWACSLCCCLSTSWLFTCRQSFIVFFDVQLSTTSLRSPTTGHLSTGFSWFPSV